MPPLKMAVYICKRVLLAFFVIFIITSTCFMLTHSLSHFITMPDFTAYKFADRKNLSTWICRRLYGVQGVSWTLQTKEEYDIALKEGWIPIFENFTP